MAMTMGGAPCPQCGTANVGARCPVCGFSPLAAGFPTEQVLPTPHPTTSAISIVAVVLGVLWGFGVLSVVAITCGVIGLVETNSPAKKGRVLAQLGIGLGVLGLVGLFALSAINGDLPTRDDPIAASSCRSDYRAVRTAVAAYVAENNRVPSSFEALTPYLAERSFSYSIAPSSNGDAVTIVLTRIGVSRNCPDRSGGTGPGASATTVSVTTVPTGAIQDANEIVCRSELGVLQTYAEEYFEQFAEYPTTDSQLVGAGITQTVPIYYTFAPTSTKTRLELIRTEAGEQVGCKAP